MKKPSSITVFLASCATLGLISIAPAFAEEPMDIPGGTRIEDTTGALGSSSDLQQSIDKLASEHQINLYVVTIDKFESPSSSDEWTKALAKLNNMGSNDVVLVIATEERAAKFMAGSDQTLSEKQVNVIYSDNIFPKLQQSDYEGAGLAAAQGIDEQLSGSGLGGFGGVATGVATLGGIAVVAGGASWLANRKRRSRGAASSSNDSRSAKPSQPLIPIPQLRTEAGQLLVSTDDAIANSLQEVEFARLQYGEKEVKPFIAAIDNAKQHMQRSFQLQKQLDDDIPDTEEEQRSWLTEIINRCKDAQKSLGEQEKNFADLRKLEQNAPQVLETLDTNVAELESAFEQAESSLSHIKTRYAASAYETVADNIEQAHSRQEFAQESVDTARAHIDSNRSEAILEIRAGEEAVGQARGLLNAVVTAETELAKAHESLSSAITLARRDVAQAKELSKYQATSELAGAAAGVEAVINQIEAESKKAMNDPLALSRKLTEVRSDLDQALGTVREIQDRERSARATLQHTLASAQAQVSTASDYVWARRGGIQAEARTTLREAERHLFEAQRLQGTDPITALAQANDAIRLATDAQRIAQNDVNQFNQYYGNYGRGRSDNSAMLGGILLGTLLSGNNGGFGGSGHFGDNRGGFGGGFGGGDFGGGGFGGPSAGGTF